MKNTFSRFSETIRNDCLLENKYYKFSAVLLFIAVIFSRKFSIEGGFIIFGEMSPVCLTAKCIHAAHTLFITNYCT